MAPTTTQARVIADLKAGRPEQFSIPIRYDPGTTAGRLRPVTHDLAQASQVVDALYRWRTANMAAFLTVFDPTPEKTRGYLSSFSLSDPARLLFLIADRDDRLIGHIGFCNVTGDAAEIDNVIRGELVDSPDFMVRAHRAVLGWAFTNLDVPLIYLGVLASNTRAIKSYERAGFVAAGRTPLVRLDTDDGYRLLPAASLLDEANAELIRMEISREAFERRRAVHQTAATP